MLLLFIPKSGNVTAFTNSKLPKIYYERTKTTMKNSIKRILAIVMALAVLFSLSVSAFAAATPEATIDYSRTGSLSLYKYDMTYL